MPTLISAWRRRPDRAGSTTRPTPALLELVKHATPRRSTRARSHGMCVINADQVNADLLAFPNATS
ncbi:hypothetical protein ACU4GD_32065 [Cupriavidus basilensis]